MYMNTRANLDYWSTDNCCIKWSLKTGACTIGTLSLLWQGLMVWMGVMMIFKCPQPVLDAHNTTANFTVNDTQEVTTTTLSTVQPAVLGVNNSLNDRRDSYTSTSGETSEDTSERVQDEVIIWCERNATHTVNTSSIEIAAVRILRCMWLPEPQSEMLGIEDQEKLQVVASLFISYSGIYCILSFCVIVGAYKKSVTLLQGWVAMTSFHNLLILLSLLAPLPFTTLSHLLCSIAYFVMSLYTWAVVKSYMHKLKVEELAAKPLLPDGAITDYTVDGLDVTQIPVQV